MTLTSFRRAFPLILLGWAAGLGAAAKAAEPVPPSLEAILDRFVAASGGETAIRKIHSRVFKGTLRSESFGQASWRMFAKAPDQRLNVTEIPGFGTMTDGCDGRTVWMQNPMMGVIERSGIEAQRSLRDARFYRDLEMQEVYPGLKVVGADRAGEEPTWRVEAASGEDNLDRFHFSQASGRLLRHVGEFAGQATRTKTVTDFADFKQVDGVNIPHKIRLRIVEEGGAEMTLEVELTEVKHNVEIDGTRFKKPEG